MVVSDPGPAVAGRWPGYVGVWASWPSSRRHQATGSHAQPPCHEPWRSTNLTTYTLYVDGRPAVLTARTGTAVPLIDRRAAADHQHHRRPGGRHLGAERRRPERAHVDAAHARDPDQARARHRRLALQQPAPGAAQARRGHQPRRARHADRRLRPRALRAARCPARPRQLRRQLPRRSPAHGIASTRPVAAEPVHEHPLDRATARSSSRPSPARQATTSRSRR